MVTDEQIMNQVKGGEIERMELLYNRYHKKLYNFFIGMVQNRHLSSDLTHNVFERMIQYRHSFSDSYTFRSWMYRIAINVRNDEYRSEARQQRLLTEKVQQAEVSTADQRMVAEEIKNLAQRALDGIHPDYRKVIWMAWYQKMKYAEIAEILDATEGAIKVKMHRAVKALRREYQKIKDQ